jgi:adenosine/AMP kinase
VTTVELDAYSIAGPEEMNVIVGRVHIVKTIEDTEEPTPSHIRQPDYEEAEGIGAGHFVSIIPRKVLPSSLLLSGQHHECSSLMVAMT